MQKISMGKKTNKNKDQGKEELEIAIAIQNEVCWKTERTFHLSLGRVAGCGWVCLCLCVSVRAKARYPRSSLPAFIGSSIKLLCVIRYSLSNFDPEFQNKRSKYPEFLEFF